ncbi:MULTISPECIES: DUF3732 domain-containing protein [Paraburkholderia]|uniref:DUF3732 domain-containing protein n=1 Tax=Paraburkholderia TaxID=1822464 RepID=UPI00225546E4|nr:MULTISPECIES: DUF3732 domain-containing protein [Paraburkholderia]MCX4177664.1 DUF3732 domain-containing protein [Paraburkholderia madseniana]MDQ6465653.1 DUF3732 domain-containing protein [Paraburkholderia madseniana]
MQFFISELILWPKNQRFKIRTLEFAEDKVNVIHGRSRTGKSSIIAIIDYCLGSKRCTIPVGEIRQKTDWFGLKVRIRDTWVLIGRRTPPSSFGSGEFFFLTLDRPDAPIPTRIEATHTHSQYKDAFNRIARVTNMSLVDDEDAENAENRPSYRDLAAFNFLPQHIVANPNVLFYKTDSYEHKDKLKRVLPYALGIVDAAYLQKARERTRLMKNLETLHKVQQSREIAFASWQVEVRTLWNESVELGLADDRDGMSLEACVLSLKALNGSYVEGRLAQRLRAPQYGFSNQLFRDATEQEEKAQRKVDDLVQELRDYQGLSDRAKKLSSAVEEEVIRVVNLDWLQRSLVRDQTCVVCGSASNHNHDVLNGLEERLDDVTRLSAALLEGPIVDRQLAALDKSLSDAEDELHIARMYRLSFEPKAALPMESLGRAYVLLGKLQALLRALATLDGDDDLGERIRDIEEKLAQLEGYFQNCGREQREAQVAEQLDELIRGYAKWFELTSKGVIELDQQELTLSFSKVKGGRKDFLWEIGSGANWMAYHVSTFLALHEYFTEPERVNGPVFSFLAIDQPSQVFFPSASSGENQLDGHEWQAEGLRGTRDADITDTRNIFKALSRGIERAKFQYQIIVVEHADKSIWGEVKHMNPVAAWKSKGDGLIPREWFGR